MPNLVFPSLMFISKDGGENEGLAHNNCGGICICDSNFVIFLKKSKFLLDI